MIYESGSVPRRTIFFPRETSPEIGGKRTLHNPNIEGGSEGGFEVYEVVGVVFEELPAVGEQFHVPPNPPQPRPLRPPLVL